MSHQSRTAQQAANLTEFDAHLDDLMFHSTVEIGELSPLLAGMIRYHFGWADRDLAPIEPSSIDRGKRIRPRLAILAARAAGGSVGSALPLAAAIELLHNFTLVHDDIQDQSPLRRHRETVWSLWGTAQAINTGDAIYAASRRMVLRIGHSGLEPGRVTAIASEFDRVAIEIVAGQVADIELEGGRAASVDDYLSMIAKKTAAIVRFSAWSGAEVGGANAEQSSLFAEFGKSLGLGFQIRDDVLGIWGATEQTGKLAADDIRRRKQSLPLILLRNRAAESHLNELSHIYGGEEITEADVDRVLRLMEQYEVRHEAESLVSGYHDQANNLLETLAPSCFPDAIDELRSFVSAMALRTY